MTVLGGVRVVTPSSVLDNGWVEVSAGQIVAVGDGAPSEPVDDLGGGWLLPGFIDLHMHGGGGHDVAASYDEAVAAVAFHRAHGTTATLASLVAAPPAQLTEQLAWITRLTSEGLVLGAHLEGPFLARSHCGAQNPAHLLAPELSTLAALLDSGCVRVMTIAPELPGALDLVRYLVADGAVPAIGHTGCGYDDAIAAFDAGAGLVTHLGNGMPALIQREPGPIGAALERGIPSELINDGVHVHPALLRLVGDAAVLVTDAISATGSTDGTYLLGGQDVRVVDGVARLVATDSLAGSTLTMDAAVRRAVVEGGLSITGAAAAAATTPAAVLGLSDERGAIQAGLAADLVLLDDHLRVRRVMVAGAWLP